MTIVAVAMGGAGTNAICCGRTVNRMVVITVSVSGSGSGSAMDEGIMA